MKIFICNAFSLSMLDRNIQRRPPADPLFQPRVPHPEDDPIGFLAAWEATGAEIISAVGHESTANILSAALCRSIPANRTSVKLDADSLALIGQYVGPRLPEGATTLPEGATLEWWVV